MILLMLLNVTQINEDYIPTVAFYLPIPLPSTHIMDINMIKKKFFRGIPTRAFYGTEQCVCKI